MQVRHAHKLVVPSRHNAYRPHLLRRSSLVFFMTLVLLSEATLAGAQFETTAMRANVAAVAAASPTSITNQTVKQIARLFTDPTRSTDWLLGAVAVILAALIIFALVLRPQVQPVHALAPAMALLCLALLLIVLNTTVLGPTNIQTAATDFSSQ